MFDELRRHHINLAQPRLGAEVVHTTDDFFADKARLIDPADPVFIPGKYDANGKWMDGWESRRKRIPGHDYCVIRLGVPGRVEKDWSVVPADARVDLLAMENGGRGIIANDEHYGCVENLTAPGRGGRGGPAGGAPPAP